MPNEKVTASANGPVVKPIAPQQVVPKTVVICSWDDNLKRWDLDLNDNEGKSEITHVMQNRLKKAVHIKINRRRRELSIKRRGKFISQMKKEEVTNG